MAAQPGKRPRSPEPGDGALTSPPAKLPVRDLAGGLSDKVVYMTSPEYRAVCCSHPRLADRAELVHALAAALGYVRHCTPVVPGRASRSDLEKFHDKDYVDVLNKAADRCDEDSDSDSEFESKAEEYGLVDDCPPFGELWDYVLLVAGASLQAADLVAKGECKYAINWAGGWHHAARDQAQGFCYVNDCVLAVLRLREAFERVLYIDIDLHHGDGVEDAFATSTNVMTLSIHKHERGFFPGTGAVSDIGMHRGRYYAVNVPLRSGCSDGTLVEVFAPVANAVYAAFKPQVVVMQCGADGLLRDPNAAFNLTTHGLGACVTTVLEWDVPVLFLGGGGYHVVDTARAWAYMTGLIVAHAKRMDAGLLQLAGEVPYHDYFQRYEPDFQLHTQQGNQRDENTPDYIAEVKGTVLENIKSLST